MGQRPLNIGQPSQNSKFNKDQWRDQITKEVGNSLGEYQTIINIHNHRKLDRYQIYFKNMSDFNHYWEMYMWRKNRHYIHRTHYFTFQNITTICQQNKYPSQLYLEHVSWRLSEIKDIPFPQNIYCIKGMLRGYCSLFSYYGGFKVCEEQVCINDKGSISVWFNRNLSSHQKQELEQDLGIKRVLEKHIESWKTENNQRIQEIMVNEIIKIAISNTDSDTEPKPSLQEYYQSFKLAHRPTFEGALTMIEQYIQTINLCKKNQESSIIIPNNFYSIILLNKMKEVQPSGFKIDEQLSTQKLPLSTEHAHKKNIPSKNTMINELFPKRPTTYCQSLPTKYTMNFYSPQKNQLLHKNKSEETLQNKNVYPLPLTTKRFPNLCYPLQPQNQTERILPKNVGSNEFVGYKRPIPQFLLGRKPCPVKITYESPKFISYSKTPKNYPLNSLNPNPQRFPQKKKPNIHVYTSKNINQTCKNSSHKLFSKKWPQNLKAGSESLSTERLTDRLPVTSSVPSNYYSAPQKTQKLFYFSSSGDKMMLDTEIAHDLQIYNL